MASSPIFTVLCSATTSASLSLGNARGPFNLVGYSLMGVNHNIILRDGGPTGVIKLEVPVSTGRDKDLNFGANYIRFDRSVHVSLTAAVSGDVLYFQ